MLVRYVVADLLRNPRRTLSTMVGVTLGVGLFCSVLFFVDGLSASMTRRAVEPLPIDMQRIVTARIGSALFLTQAYDRPGPAAAGDRVRVVLEVRNTGQVAAHEVTVRSLPGADVGFVAGSAEVDEQSLPGGGNPFAHGPGETGLNLGSIPPGATRRLTYRVQARAATEVTAGTVTSSYSSRESVSPVAANQPSMVPLGDLARVVGEVPGVADASELSFAALGTESLSSDGAVAGGPAKIFGFDQAYADRDATVRIVAGRITPDGGVLSAEAAATLGVGIGDPVTVALPDGSALDLAVSGIADLSRARSLFSSRRGGDLETFIYVRNAIVVSPRVFAETVLPAYERAASGGGERLNSVDLDRTISPYLSASTKANIVNNPVNLQSALMLGSPDFMYR